MLEEGVGKLLPMICRLPLSVKVLPEYFKKILMAQCPSLEIITVTESVVGDRQPRTDGSKSVSSGDGSNVWCANIAHDIKQTLYSRMGKKFKKLVVDNKNLPQLKLVEKAKAVRFCYIGILSAHFHSIILYAHTPATASRQH